MRVNQPVNMFNENTTGNGYPYARRTRNRRCVSNMCTAGRAKHAQRGMNGIVPWPKKKTTPESTDESTTNNDGVAERGTTNEL